MIKLNGRNMEIRRFPNGELYMKDLLIHGTKETVDFFYDGDEDIFHLILLKRHLDTLSKEVKLYMHYMPYSRKDRAGMEEVFTLKYVTEIINGLKFAEVVVDEPHSDVTVALLDRGRAVYPVVSYLEEVIYKASPSPNYGLFNHPEIPGVLVFPDTGAAKRYSQVATLMGLPYVVGYKEREKNTGKITSMRIIGDLPKVPFRALIVDDLCSYGGTFMLAGNALKMGGALEVYLFIAHCESSIFEGDIFKDDSPITKVFCTDSLMSASKVHCEAREHLCLGQIEIVGGKR